MMILHPCCGGSLRNGARVLATLEFFTSAGFFIGGLIALQKFANASNVGENNESGGDVPMLLFGLAYLVFAVSQFVLSCILFYGINTKNMKHCAKWFFGSWILLIILITFAACETYQGRLTATILWAKPVVLGLNSLFKLYCIWVVYAFMNEIRREEASENDMKKTPI